MCATILGSSAARLRLLAVLLTYWWILSARAGHPGGTGRACSIASPWPNRLASRRSKGLGSWPRSAQEKDHSSHDGEPRSQSCQHRDAEHGLKQRHRFVLVPQLSEPAAHPNDHHSGRHRRQRRYGGHQPGTQTGVDHNQRHHDEGCSDGGALPGQRRALSLKAGTLRGRAHRRVSSTRLRNSIMAARTMTPPASTLRARGAGNALPIRRALSPRVHPATARQASRAPPTHEAAPIRAVHLGTVDRLVTEMTATPAATSAKAVRIQARAVRSLARLDRGSGSSPWP